MNNGVIAMFVKTPGLSPVKTRLAAHIGQSQAEQFYRLAIAASHDVITAFTRQHPVQAMYAVAEHAAMAHPLWQALPCIWQGEGGLGERMSRVYRQLLIHHDFVILVGSDIPQMQETHLQQAVIALHDYPMALAPSLDGGFWLFAGRCELPDSIWTQVAYSQPDTAAQFAEQLTLYGAIKILHALQDVDTVEDLEPLTQTLIACPRRTPAQQTLLNFLQHILQANA